MAKDDYFYVVYRILSYLYQCLKRGHRPDITRISYGGDLCGINKRYWLYIMKNMLAQGFVEGIFIAAGVGEYEFDIGGLEDIEITPMGIEYLCENGTIAKARKAARDLTDTISPFI